MNIARSWCLRTTNSTDKCLEATHLAPTLPSSGHIAPLWKFQAIIWNKTIIIKLNQNPYRKELCCFTSKWRHVIPLCLTCLFLFLMIKDTLLPTVQKHTLENTGHFQITCKQPRESQKWALRAALVPAREGKFRELGTADDDLSNQGAKIVTQQQYCGRKGHNCITTWRGTNLFNVFFPFFFFANFQLMV